MTKDLGSSEVGMEPSGSIKGRKYPEFRSNYMFLRKSSAQFSWLVS
jgi:hypothetical protein